MRSIQAMYFSEDLELFFSEVDVVDVVRSPEAPNITEAYRFELQILSEKNKSQRRKRPSLQTPRLNRPSWLPKTHQDWMSWWPHIKFHMLFDNFPLRRDLVYLVYYDVLWG